MAIQYIMTKIHLPVLVKYSSVCLERTFKYKRFKLFIYCYSGCTAYRNWRQVYVELVTNTHQTQPVVQFLRLQQCTGCAQMCTRNVAKHFIYICSCCLCRTDSCKLPHCSNAIQPAQCFVVLFFCNSKWCWSDYQSMNHHFSGKQFVLESMLSLY